MDDDEDDDIQNSENLPIFKKGQEIFEVVHQICDLIPEDNDYLQFLKGQMLSDATMLTVKIAGAEGGNLYDIRKECCNNPQNCPRPEDIEPFT